MFVVHNTTSSRITLRLLPSIANDPGTPRWQARRIARQQTFNVAIDPNVNVDLEAFGYTEKQLNSQSELTKFLEVGRLIRLKSVTAAVPVPVELIEVAPVVDAPIAPVAVVDEPIQTESTTELVDKTEASVVPDEPVRTPFNRFKKQKR